MHGIMQGVEIMCQDKANGVKLDLPPEVQQKRAEFWKNTYERSPLNRLVGWAELQTLMTVSLQAAQLIVLILIFIYLRRLYIRGIVPVV